MCKWFAVWNISKLVSQWTLDKPYHTWLHLRYLNHAELTAGEGRLLLFTGFGTRFHSILLRNSMLEEYQLKCIDDRCLEDRKLDSFIESKETVGLAVIRTVSLKREQALASAVVDTAEPTSVAVVDAAIVAAAAVAAAYSADTASGRSGHAAPSAAVVAAAAVRVGTQWPCGSASDTQAGPVDTQSAAYLTWVLTACRQASAGSHPTALAFRP